MTLLFLRLVCRDLFQIMRNLKFLLECCPSPSNGLTFCSGSLGLTPDHGHVLLDDKKRQNNFYSGYSIIGRAFGLAQLTGLEIGMGSLWTCNRGWLCFVKKGFKLFFYAAR
jgi:D-mannonate dehydratase